MGQHQFSGLLPRYSCCVPSQNPNICHENHARGHPVKVQRQRSNLSAVFTFADVAADRSTACCMVDMVNINTATEEELMTLSGINRPTAVNIIGYRRLIGTFRRVEDLALVSGIGAARLEEIRCEICVADHMHSCNGSVSSSGVELDNVSSSRNGSCRSRSGSRVRVNINTANIFQLMKIKYVTQAVAENIVMYRENKGLFTSLDELTRVKGIKPPLLSSLRPYLVLQDSNLSNKLEGNPGEETGDIGMLEKCSVDVCPIRSPLSFCYTRPGWSVTKLPSASVLRFATWRLDQCGREKMENPGVREIIAMTILENGIKVLAVQDITCGLVLQKLCDELNAPTLYYIKSWSRPRGRWKSIVPCRNSSTEDSCAVGFMFDSSFGVRLRKTSREVTSLGCKNSVCFSVDFVVNHLEVSFANFSFSSETSQAPEFRIWKDLLKAVEVAKSGVNLVFAGEFVASSNPQEIFDVFEEMRCHAVISKQTFTNITQDNPLGSDCSENIWLSPRASDLFQGFSSVVREGLSSLWIPNGWRLGGLVSSQCPVLVDLSLNPLPVKKVT